MNEEMYMGFESYLNNEMPADEKIIFEEKLQNDAQFRESFALYKETTQFLNTTFSPETLAFKMNLDAISNEHFSQTEEKTRVINLKPWYYAVAASMAIVFGMLVFNQSDPQYGDYNQHEMAQFVERGDDDVNLKAAQDYFNNHEYKKAVASFEKIQDTTNPEIQFYYAIALIETNNYQKAEIFLNNLKDGTSVYKDKAVWYLALSNLKQKKIAECKVLLQQIPQDAEDFDKGQQLLNDLD
ncbi:MAG: tetratricopeptide repeat protein [Bacteroidota bacterium]